MPFDSQISSDGSSGTAADVQAQSETMHAPDEAEMRVAPIWLQRLSLLVLVLFCVIVGGFVMFLPWLPRFWDHIGFVQARPALWAVLHLGAVRGMISGVGLLDIWIGVSEAIHYKDHRASSGPGER